jgi:uncharacterized protein YqiB (DUF1249 family)
MTVKKAFVLLLITCQIFTACNMTSPEKYFDEAVLNCNSIDGVSGDGLLRELESPAVKLAEGSKTKTVAMTRKEVMDVKIQVVEENFKRLKKLRATDETKEMLQTSISLHEYALGIYKNEYTELAKMYDEGAARDQILSKAQAIHDKYSTRFEALFEKLTALGKSYAEKHNIAVKWGY